MNKPTFLLNYQTLAEFTEHYEENQDEPPSKTAVTLLSIKQGTGHCLIDDIQIALKPGTMIVVNPPSRLRPVNTQLMQGSVITFEPELFPTIDMKEEYCEAIIGDCVKYILLDLAEDAVMCEFTQSQIQMFSWQYRLYINSLIKQQFLVNILSVLLLSIVRSLSLPYVSRILKDTPECSLEEA